MGKLGLFMWRRERVLHAERARVMNVQMRRIVEIRCIFRGWGRMLCSQFLRTQSWRSRKLNVARIPFWA